MSTVGIATAALGRARFRYANEDQLQRGLAEVFTGAGLAVRREVHLGVDGRIDFVLTHSVSTRVVGVEVKVAGSSSEVLAQLRRYAGHVDDLLLVTTRLTHKILSSAIISPGRGEARLMLRGPGWTVSNGPIEDGDVLVRVHHLRGGGL